MTSSFPRRVRGEKDYEGRERPSQQHREGDRGEGAHEHHPPVTRAYLRLPLLLRPWVQDVADALHQAELHDLLLHGEHGEHVADDGDGVPLAHVRAGEVRLDGRGDDDDREILAEKEKRARGVYSRVKETNWAVLPKIHVYPTSRYIRTTIGTK